MNSFKKNRLKEIYSQSKLKPPYNKKPFLYRFWIFQKERIPLIIMWVIAISLTAAVSKANNHFQWGTVIIATLMIVLYFLQIRLADEPKDFEHDNKYYPDRPVQRGVITLRELNEIKNIVIVSFLALACLTGSWVVIVLSLFQQFYSYLTREEFFVRTWLRKHFLTYQFSHYIQLFILAWLILTVVRIQPLNAKCFYFVYVMLMIGMIESSRTIGGTDKLDAKDRYSYRLGLNVALMFFVAFTFAVIGFTVFIIITTKSSLIYSPVMLIGLLSVGYAAIKYKLDPLTKNAEIMNAASLIMFLCSALTLILST